MSNDQRWWQTLPGMLTAGAAIITAVGGLLAILLQHGIIAGDGKPNAPSDVAGPQTTEATQPVRTPPAAPQSSAESPVDAKAVFTARDGGTTEVRAETVRYCSVVGETIKFGETQDVPLEKIQRIDIERSDDPFVPNGKAVVVVIFTSGQVLRTTIPSNCDLFGFNELGRFSLYPHKLQRLEFLR
jgi:hypothetical protein